MLSETNVKYCIVLLVVLWWEIINSKECVPHIIESCGSEAQELFYMEMSCISESRKTSQSQTSRKFDTAPGLFRLWIDFALRSVCREISLKEAFFFKKFVGTISRNFQDFSKYIHPHSTIKVFSYFYWPLLQSTS
jgi:hypothetical protein